VGDTRTATASNKHHYTAKEAQSKKKARWAENNFSLFGGDSKYPLQDQYKNTSSQKKPFKTLSQCWVSKY